MKQFTSLHPCLRACYFNVPQCISSYGTHLLIVELTTLFRPGISARPLMGPAGAEPWLDIKVLTGPGPTSVGLGLRY